MGSKFYWNGVEQSREDGVKFPQEGDLHKALLEHLAEAACPERAALVWRGYLAGIFEWGLIPFEVYSRLYNLLPKDLGAREVVEIFLGPKQAREEFLKSDDKEPD